MQLDQCVGFILPSAKLSAGVELSSAWAGRCFKAHTRPDPGALWHCPGRKASCDLRKRSIEHLESIGDFPGYGIGGYSVGEPHGLCLGTRLHFAPITCHAISLAPGRRWYPS